MSYVPVVGGGKNALTLHYVQNTQILRDGDLLLVDAGVEYNGYASDITRTWPINGRFSDAQRELYQCILHVQKEIIKVCHTSFSIELTLKNSECKCPRRIWIRSKTKLLNYFNPPCMLF